jgi:nitroreductase
MKKPVALALLCLFASAAAFGQDRDIVGFISSTYSARAFTAVKVTDEQLTAVLQCGIKAPSARNTQLWKFTVVRDKARGAKIVPDFKDGNVLIIVSGLEQSQPGIDVVFDCALAAENMYLAAQGLGLGAHMYAIPIDKINRTMKRELKIPEGYKAIIVLRVGHIQKNLDAVTGASTRKAYPEVVN